MDDQFIYEIEYDCEWGTRRLGSSDFSLSNAVKMGLRLFEHPEDWGAVTRVQITKTDRLLDPRSIGEIEDNFPA